MLLNAPLIRLRHLLPPQKTAGGEGLSTRGGVVLQEGCEKCGNLCFLCVICGSSYSASIRRNRTNCPRWYVLWSAMRRIWASQLAVLWGILA
jgi:hypothetical protein